MNRERCPDLEELFQGLEDGDRDVQAHLSECPSCAAVVEEHRQLEKDLVRLADPLPPPDFVHQVMAKVQRAPVPVRREVWTGLSILSAAFAAIGVVFVSDAATAGAFGTTVASLIVQLSTIAAAVGQGVKTVWTTAALPVTVVASLFFLTALLGLRRLAAPAGARVRVSR